MTTPTPRKPKRHIGLWILAAFVAFIVIGNLGDDDKDESASRPTETTSSQAKPQPAATSYGTIPGNGTHQIGGMDGKNWGVYTATVPAGSTCQWSIRSVAPYRGGEILNEGQAGAGETVRASIQPDGSVSAITGLIDDDHRIVFMTSGCGSWEVNP